MPISENKKPQKLSQSEYHAKRDELLRRAWQELEHRSLEPELTDEIEQFLSGVLPEVDVEDAAEGEWCDNGTHTPPEAVDI